MKIERFEDIEAWQAARELTRQIYKATVRGQFARDYGLPREIHGKGLISRGERDQIQRATVSIMANISEGFDANSDDEFVRSLRYALRSATEVQSHLYAAIDQDYISEGDFDDLYKQAAKVKSLIAGFIRYLRH